MTLFAHRERFTLQEAEPLDLFWGVRADVEKLALASYFAEAAGAAAEEGRPDPALLSLALNSLYALDKLRKPLPLVKAAFELKLLCVAGYEPLLDACAVCGDPQPREPRLDLAEGVLRCAACGLGDGADRSLGRRKSGRHAPCGLRRPQAALLLYPGRRRPGPHGAACEDFLLRQLERGFSTLDFYRRLTAGGA